MELYERKVEKVGGELVEAEGRCLRAEARLEGKFLCGNVCFEKFLRGGSDLKNVRTKIYFFWVGWVTFFFKKKFFNKKNFQKIFFQDFSKKNIPHAKMNSSNLNLGTPTTSFEKRMTRSQVNTPKQHFQLGHHNEVISVEDSESTLDALYKTALDNLGTDSSCVFEESPRLEDPGNFQNKVDKIDPKTPQKLNFSVDSNSETNKENHVPDSTIVRSSKDFVSSSQETFVVSKSPIKVSEANANDTERKNYKKIINDQANQIKTLQDKIELQKEVAEIRTTDLNHTKNDLNQLNHEYNLVLKEKNNLKIQNDKNKISISDLQNENKNLRLAIEALRGQNLALVAQAENSSGPNNCNAGPNLNKTPETINPDLLKRSVKFNQLDLTPEIIDSRLPAGTPVRRGRKPEQTTPGRGLLKKKPLPKEAMLANVSTRDSLFNECEEASKAIQQLKMKFSERAQEQVQTSPEFEIQKQQEQEELDQQLSINKTEKQVDTTQKDRSFMSPPSNGNNEVSMSISLLEDMQSQLNQLKLIETPNKNNSSRIESENLGQEENLANILNFTNVESPPQEEETPMLPETVSETKSSELTPKTSQPLQHKKWAPNQESIDIQMPQETVEFNSVEQCPPNLPTPEKNSKSEPEKSKSEKSQSKTISNSETDSESASKKEERIKRISIANQNSVEKAKLEEKRKRFIEQRENKKRNKQSQGNQNQTVVSNQNNQINEINNQETSPDVFSSRRVRGQGQGQSQSQASTAISTTSISKSVVTQQRREKAKMQHEKQKQLMENTLRFCYLIIKMIFVLSISEYIMLYYGNRISIIS